MANDFACDGLSLSIRLAWLCALGSLDLHAAERSNIPTPCYAMTLLSIVNVGSTCNTIEQFDLIAECKAESRDNRYSFSGVAQPTKSAVRPRELPRQRSSLSLVIKSGTRVVAIAAVDLPSAANNANLTAFPPSKHLPLLFSLHPTPILCGLLQQRLAATHRDKHRQHLRQQLAHHDPPPAPV